MEAGYALAGEESGDGGEVYPGLAGDFGAVDFAGGHAYSIERMCYFVKLSKNNSPRGLTN